MLALSAVGGARAGVTWRTRATGRRPTRLRPLLLRSGTARLLVSARCVHGHVWR